MAGRRLLDAAKLFAASNSVAKQHINLRARQFDIYTRTSSLAKAVKEQTDRVTLTAKAAIALAQRFNEPPPSYTSNFPPRQSETPRDESIPRQTNISDSGDPYVREEGITQDHHYESSPRNSAWEPASDKELRIEQEGAGRTPLPDGSVPPGKTLKEEPPVSQDTFSKRPLTEPPKQPLSEEQHRAGTHGVKPAASNESTIPRPLGRAPLTAAEARWLQLQAEARIPSHATIPDSKAQSGSAGLTKGLNEDVFYSPAGTEQATTSSLPRSKIPKYENDTQESVEDVGSGKINGDVFARPSSATGEELPEGIDTNVFRSPRVSKMLGGGLKGGGLKSESARTPMDPKSPQEVVNRSSAASVTAEEKDEIRNLASAIAKDADNSASSGASEIPSMEVQKQAYQLRESRVPSSRIGRIWQYGGLGVSMALGAMGEGFRRATGSGVASGSLVLSPANIETLVGKLSRMRGAALKLGQMMSFQDLKTLPPAIHEVLQRVQDGADYMPASQRNKVLAKNLGPDWKDLFSSFEDVPIAAASIGQVHKATLRSTGQAVAVKVQYPGVAESIDSDLNNLSLLLTASRLLPKGLYLDKTIANARTELGWECDYAREAQCQLRFEELLKDETDTFRVPHVFLEASGPQVLTGELMTGIAVTKNPSLTQEQRDWIGTQVLRLCFREIAEFRFMQTDPNWTNFLYNAADQKLELLDFGASRDYPVEFIDPYMRTLAAAVRNDRDAVQDLSVELGYLIGSESRAMLDAHVNSVLTLAEPFGHAAPDVYDFRNQTVTDRVRGFIPTMVQERLTPPPEETYSLHRKLSGAFLLCARLGSRVPCRALFQDALQKYEESIKGAAAYAV